MTESLIASAPGSAMIMGEHAVLDNYPAIVAAVDYRITVTLTPRSDQRLVIHSQLGEHSQSLDYLIKQPPFEGIIACCQLLQNSLAYGFELTIDSQMSHQVGLGSSAAVIVATLAVLQRWQYGELDRHQLLIWAQQAMNQQQGQGSGADLAASVYGGILAYQKQPLSIDHLPVPEDSFKQTNIHDSHKKSQLVTGTQDVINQTIDSPVKPVLDSDPVQQNDGCLNDNDSDSHKNLSPSSFSGSYTSFLGASTSFLGASTSFPGSSTPFPHSSTSFPRRRESSAINSDTGSRTPSETTASPDHFKWSGEFRDDGRVVDTIVSKSVTPLQFGLLYCGHKKPTAQVIQWLQQQFADQSQLLQHYYQAIGGTVSLAIDAWQQQDWFTMCQQIAINQRYMEELGLCHESLVKLKQLCDNDPYMEAAKVSGSGLGDCLLGLGDWSRSELRHQANYIPMPIAQEGVVCH